jgi:penicillin-binding protein 2
LRQPDSVRCAIFRRTGVGHGPVTLADALARSCNVYFFHHAEQLGAGPIIDWAQKFGLGRPSGIELAGEAAGGLPTATDAKNNPNDPRPMSIGQSTITVTPLQMAVVAAAIANGGTLVKPTIVDGNVDLSLRERNGLGSEPNTSINALRSEQLLSIQDGLRLAVADEQGTAHSTVELADIAIAGKTGTAQTGGGRPDHAWFVGYAPAERPQIAFAVVLEHGGDGALAAGPIAKHLVAQLHEAGYFVAKGPRPKLGSYIPNSGR